MVREVRIGNVTPKDYWQERYAVVDFETTNHSKGSPHDERNTTVCVGVRGSGTGPQGEDEYYVESGNEYQLDRLRRTVERAEFLVVHNGKFELGWLERCGLVLTDILIYDTLLGDYVRAGGRRWQLDLDSVAKRYDVPLTKDPVVGRMIKGGVCPSEIPSHWLEEYCLKDVDVTHVTFLKQRQVLEERGLLQILLTRCLLTPVLVDMEKEGLQLDGDRLLEVAADAEGRWSVANQALLEYAPINWNSPKQRSEFIYGELKFKEKRVRGKPDRTPTGGKKTDQDTVSSLRAWTPKQRRFLELYLAERSAFSELSKYLRKFRSCVEDSGGLLKAVFNQSRTKTHRLSSSGAHYKTQLQNLPRAYKRLFRAKRDGWLMGEADGSQLEFRVATHLGRDEQGLADIVSGVDVHSRSATIIYGPAPKGADKHPRRQDAKADTFKPLYGGRSGTQSQRRYYADFRDRYAGITRTQQSWIDEAISRGYVQTEYGLRYYFSGVRMQHDGYVTNSTNICNYPVQGFATAEIIPIALIFMWHRIRSRGYDMRLVNTVHDSIIAEVPPDEVEIFKELARECLIDAVYDYLHRCYKVDLVVPLGCGIKVSKFWGDTNIEEKYEASRELYDRSAV